MRLGYLLLLACALSAPARAERGLSGGPFAGLQLCAPRLATLAARVANNKFQYQRGLLEYRQAFGGEFWVLLMRLKPGEQWLDAGSGAGVAQAEYQTGTPLAPAPPEGELFPLPSAFPAERAITKGVVVTLPREGAKYRERVEAHGAEARFLTLAGREIESIPPAELGTAKLITDFFGPVSYSPDLTAVMDKYLEVAAPDADLFLKFGYEKHLIETKDGRRMKLFPYLEEKLGGHVVRPTDPLLEMSAHIRLKPGGVRKFPKLTLKETANEKGLPSFYYKEE